MNVLAFDIETVPDVEAGRRLLDLGDLDDDGVVRAMQANRREQTGGRDFLPPHLHRIVAISVGLRQGERFRVWSLGEASAGEAELVQRFFDGIEKFQPDLVSWNGTGFDLPVLHYRALLHGVAAARYWETGDSIQPFRWNNYLNRFHWRHLDLMDVLAGFQGRASARLEEIAIMLGLPGKLGMHGSLVWDRFHAGDMAAIRNYCEIDVLNTYLVFLRFQLTRGQLSHEEYLEETVQVRRFLEEHQDQTHFREFLAGWTPREIHQAEMSNQDKRGDGKGDGEAQG